MPDARMFAKLDLGYFDNPKVADFIDDRPRVPILHLRAILYSRQHLTDGRFPIRLVCRMVSASYCGSHCEQECDYCTAVAAGLFDRDDERQGMVHDYLEHQQSTDDVQRLSKAGRKAAAARWSSDSDANGNADGTSKRTANGTPNGNPMGNAEREEREERETKGASTSVERDFDTWYQAYPRKRGRGQALKAYRSACKKTDPQTLLASVESQRQVLTKDGLDLAPYPATWLNGERWLDEIGTPANDGPPRLLSIAEVRRLEAERDARERGETA